MAKIVKVEDAIGEMLLHDITKVDPEKGFKGRIFKKGHVIREEDVKTLKDVGKDHIYVFELDKDEVHENDAAIALSKEIAGENTYCSKEPKEGKITIYADCSGVCKVDVEKLYRFNSIGEPSCPTIYNNSVVEKGDKLAAVRIISLMAPKNEVDKALEVAKGGIVKVVPFEKRSAGLIVTGNEVYHGRIKDKFFEKLKPKLKELQCDLKTREILPDDKERIRDKIVEFSKEYDLVILSGGTSVDPDDVTYKAVKEAGVEGFVRGNPIQPGNMLTFGYIKDTPVVAVPAAALFFKKTAFDLWLPRFLIGERVTKEEVLKRAHGGLLEAIKDIR